MSPTKAEIKSSEVAGDVPISDANDLESFASQFEDAPTDKDPTPQQPSDPQKPKAETSDADPADDPTTESPDSPSADATDKTTDSDEIADDPEPDADPKPDKTKKSPQSKTKLEKRVDGQSKFINKLSQQLADMTVLTKKLTAKLEGTYEEPPAPTTEQVKSTARFDAIEEVSREAANERYGEDEVNTTIYSKDSPFEALVTQKPWIKVRVMASRDPVGEAFRALAQESFFEEFSHDPAIIKQKLTDQVRDKVLKELKSVENGNPPTKPPPSTRNIRTVKGESVDVKKDDTDFSLDDLDAMPNSGLASIGDGR